MPPHNRRQEPQVLASVGQIESSVKMRVSDLRQVYEGLVQLGRLDGGTATGSKLAG